MEHHPFTAVWWWSVSFNFFSKELFLGFSSHLTRGTYIGYILCSTEAGAPFEEGDADWRLDHHAPPFEKIGGKFQVSPKSWKMENRLQIFCRFSTNNEFDSDGTFEFFDRGPSTQMLAKNLGKGNLIWAVASHSCCLMISLGIKSCTIHYIYIHTYVYIYIILPFIISGILKIYELGIPFLTKQFLKGWRFGFCTLLTSCGSHFLMKWI
jgi:hypothetical protein